MTQSTYIHGFTTTEQERLLRQAQVAEFLIFQNIDFFESEHILEVGAGVGAQTEILLRRFPNLQLTGIDNSMQQLTTAQEYLSQHESFKGRYQYLEMDAKSLTFEADSFDGAFLCWILEHIPKPQDVLAQVKTVLKPGSTVVVNEVMNASFFVEPYSPNLWKYWVAFNDFQYENGGDPFIGAKLGNLLLNCGYQQVQTQIKTFHFDQRRPKRCKEMIGFWEELLLSAADQLIEAQKVDPQTVEAMHQEIRRVQTDPNAVFFYSFVQAKAIA